jgi:hypothetical protein
MGLLPIIDVVNGDLLTNRMSGVLKVTRNLKPVQLSLQISNGTNMSLLYMRKETECLS